eukprot:scaffold119363_cov57-Phaeocystis_antarctica.AAC.1
MRHSRAVHRNINVQEHNPGRRRRGSPTRGACTVPRSVHRYGKGKRKSCQIGPLARGRARARLLLLRLLC